MALATVCLALVLPLTGGLRRAVGPKTTIKSLAGVPILNYDDRYQQFGMQGASNEPEVYDWILKFKGHDTQQLLAFCGGDSGKGVCRAVGHPSTGGAPLVTLRASEERLEKLLESHPAMVEFIEADAPVDVEPVVEEVQGAVEEEPWGHEIINLNRAKFTGKGSHIYVFDTGVRSTHEDFGGRVIPTVDTTTGTPDECDPADIACASDQHGHGTHVAGTAGGTRYGVAKQATLHAMKVCCGGNTNTIAAFDWLTQKALYPAVLTMSLGSYSTPQSSRVAVDAVVNSGVTVIVSAGNRGTPSCEKSYTFIASALGVGATTEDNTRAGFSNFGPCNAIFAPGTRIVSASYTSDTGSSSKSGTSMAAPMVSGAAALLLEEDPSLKPAQVRSTLRARATVGALSELLEGDPNLLLSVGEAAPTPPTPPTPPPTPAPTQAPVKGDCPWHGCVWGCKADDCEFCDSCSGKVGLGR